MSNVIKTGRAKLVFFFILFFSLGVDASDPCLKTPEWTSEGDIGVASRASCYIDLAKKKKDLSLCKKTEKYKLISECYRMVAVAIGNAELCKNVPLNENWGRKEIDRWLCVGMIAKDTKNLALCDTIPSRDFFEASALCHPRFPDNRCSSIENVVERDQCNIASAVEQRFVRPCNLNVSQGRRGECYEAVAIKLNDPFICLSGETRQWECFSKLVKKSNKINLCEKIPKLAYKQEYDFCVGKK